MALEIWKREFQGLAGFSQGKALDFNETKVCCSISSASLGESLVALQKRKSAA